MELPIEILDTELEKLNNNEFKKTNEYIDDLEKSQEELLKNGKIPDKEIAKKVSTTKLEVDLGLSALAKSTALKLVKLEKFLSKIEDILYNEETLKEFDKGKLIALYSQTRIMRGELLKSLQEIRKTIDFDSLDAQIQAMNIQNEKNEITTLDEIVDKILNDENFLQHSLQTARDKIDEIKS